MIDKITEYLSNGGYFNPELMEHDKVRDLLMDIREQLAVYAKAIMDKDAEIKRLRQALKLIETGAKRYYREGEDSYQFAIIAQDALAMRDK